MDRRLAQLVLTGAAGALLVACGSTSAPASGGATATPSVATTTTPTATPAAGATAGPCTGSDLDLVVGAGSNASGGQEGVTALIGNHSATACQLNGAVQLQLLSSSGASLTTSQGSTPTGEAWLVPDRVALDPWEPQPGEATVLISWHTGDSAPGVCSGSAPTVDQVSMGVPGGGTVTGPVDPTPLLSQGMAPCKGVVEVGAITQVSSIQSYASLSLAADAEIEASTQMTISSGSCTPTPGQSCLTRVGSTAGTNAGYGQYDQNGTGGGAVCFAYVYQDTAGWHPLDVNCTQDTAPSSGGMVVITVPGGGCAPIHSAPGHGSSVVSCDNPSSQIVYTISGAPTYVAETDPTSHLPMGTLWWDIASLNGWIAQDWVAAPQG